MDVLIFLIPIALGMGLVGLGAFLWSLKSGQYEDMEGAAQRILIEDDDRPLPDQPAEDGPQSVQKS
ncbi:cbb3-type cytochrome oxidase assembly protein CcoS [Hyphobacterium sp. HN65]|uniref:Cbb3-type cytochrome oxidase assembly protein CcoS n=1 Tax=Hyphobacterium lacteum TaxID=3116575 RepID=A0ABU7LRI4_9PROT|nr:cbb3-type cytochrome oxidase assembly protein CcoS [Hyphobacterium sp. HN65]MEE2526527.1 cbb3-type cytochrome oxidase assembly protein CcoS [Hyphobacterium sp. HN65]